MAKANNSHKGRRKPSDSPKISVTKCPDGMSLTEWQRSLRRQVAEKSYFGINAPQEPDDQFIVGSAVSGRQYGVWYFGDGSPLNRCECMDFRTNRLGTCKHIEAISLAKSGRYRRAKYALPSSPFVYVDYVAGRKIKIYRPDNLESGLSELIDSYFTSQGELKDMSCDPSEFIRNARGYDARFRWEDDAMNLLIAARDRKRRQDIIDEKYPDSDFSGLLKTKLHPYQADGVKFSFIGGRTINADEMGLGKTVQAIATAELLKREMHIQTVIIICPTSLKYQWLSEIERFTDSSAEVIEGNLLKRHEQLTAGGAFYKIISFHAMSNNIKAGYIPSADMVIYDELQRLKNRDTQMGRQLRKLQSQYVMALSGTPLENRLEDLYSVMQLVNQYVFDPLYKFIAKHVVTADTGKVTGYKNLHTIAKQIADTLIRRKKADVRLQMPTRTDTNLFVPMTKEQRVIHDEYKHHVAQLIYKWRRFKFLSEADRKKLLLFLSMMRMVCDSTFIIDQKSRHDTKIDEILAIIENLRSSGEEKVVIFSQWERMLRILSQTLEQAGIEFCFLHGGVPSHKRKNLIDRFRDDPECIVFLSTDAGSTGLNLQSASLLINIDLPWNPAVLEQRIARIYRLGQQNPVQIINMIARDTIEEQMLSTLAFKSNLAAGILDGGDDAVFLDENRFKKVIEVVDSVIDEGKNEPKHSPDSTPVSTPEQPPLSNLQTPSSYTPSAENTVISAGKSNTEASARHKTGTSTTPEQMRSMVSESIGILSNLANMMQTPESAAMLAEALVKEDPETGQTSINIPVPDKSTVVNIFTALSKLLTAK